jgi:hypothetical protein
MVCFFNSSKYSTY